MHADYHTTGLRILVDNHRMKSAATANIVLQIKIDRYLRLVDIKLTAIT